MSAHFITQRSTGLLKQVYTSITQRNLYFFSCATLLKKVELRKITGVRTYLEDVCKTHFVPLCSLIASVWCEGTLEL